MTPNIKSFILYVQLNPIISTEDIRKFNKIFGGSYVNYAPECINCKFGAGFPSIQIVEKMCKQRQTEDDITIYYKHSQTANTEIILPPKKMHRKTVQSTPQKKILAVIKSR